MKLPVYRENISVDHCVFNHTHVYYLQRAEPHKDVWLSTPRFSPDGPGGKGNFTAWEGQIYRQRNACLELQKHESREPCEPPSLGILVLKSWEHFSGLNCAFSVSYMVLKWIFRGCQKIVVKVFKSKVALWEGYYYLSQGFTCPGGGALISTTRINLNLP